MHGSLTVQLGKSSNYQHEKAAHKVQTGETETVRLWFHLGIVHSGMHTNLPGPRGRSGEFDTTRATNGSLGSIDAQIWRWLTDVLEARVLQVVMEPADRHGRLALFGN